MQHTLSIVKPDGVGRGLVGPIIAHYEQHGLRMVAAKFKQLALPEAAGFYYVHKERPFFAELVDYMVSAPVFISVLCGKDAIQQHRTLMGATDPKQAEQGTIRALYGESIDRNTVHGSDAEDTARFEISYFFSHAEIYSDKIGLPQF